MLESLPPSIWNEIHAAQRKADRRRSRLRVEANGDSFRILRMTSEGFVVEAETTPRLRGLVDLYDGSRLLSQCLIMAASQDGDEMIYDFKRNTSAADGAPLDFERPDDAPIALLGR
ncbi:hypothetical protein [Pseudooctadecabacter sp.]|uniref:hypothetical protein n=1 Tax=Pseudooctadecabacter sp. TaxID=1966338 RepID=UPI0025DE32F7|nr:hypothetical protein [Pseudooctadecabacter sp.]